MLSLFLAAVLADASVAAPVSVVPDRQARATVRIVRTEPIRLGEDQQAAESTFRIALVRDRDGSVRSASLIEFF